MSTTNCGTDIELARDVRIKQGVLALVLLRVQSVWRALQNRTASNRLYELDDRQLDDIGITRFDVVTAMERSSVWDDPSLHLTRAARERAHNRFSRPPRR